MEEIEYRGELIHKFSDGTICAYVMNADGDIDEIPCPTMEYAMKRIDEHLAFLSTLNDEEFSMQDYD